MFQAGVKGVSERTKLIPCIILYTYIYNYRNNIIIRTSLYTDEVQAQKHVKCGQITDPDCLFVNLAGYIGGSEKHKEIGVDLGLRYEVLWDELETGIFKMQKGSEKTLKMLQLWRNSVPKDDCTYSRLAAALEKHDFHDAALKYCCD